MDAPIERLIKHFGTQESTAEALGVKQGTVSGWVRGKHGVSPAVALRAERLTGGEFTAAELCPAVFAEPVSQAAGE